MVLRQEPQPLSTLTKKKAGIRNICYIWFKLFNKMKKIIIPICILLASCGGGKQTAEEVAKEWCELNKKVHEATDEAATDKARDAREKFESEMEEKYKGDEAFMEQVEDETEKCEEESEGVKDYDGD